MPPDRNQHFSLSAVFYAEFIIPPILEYSFIINYFFLLSTVDTFVDTFLSFLEQLIFIHLFFIFVYIFQTHSSLVDTTFPKRYNVW